METKAKKIEMIRALLNPERTNEERFALLTANEADEFLELNQMQAYKLKWSAQQESRYITLITKIYSNG